MFLKAETTVQMTDVEAWAETIRKTFGGLQISVSDPSTFEGAIDVYSMDEFNLVMVKSSPARVWHTGSIGAFSETERFLVKMQFSGRSTIKFGSSVVDLSPGDFLICDNARSYSLSFEEETEILSIPIPLSVLGRFHAKPSELAFKTADRTLAINNILSDYLTSLWQSRSMKSAKTHAKRLINNCFDLLVLGFADFDGSSFNISSTQHGHLDRCREYIKKNYMEEGLSPASIAKELAISERYLYSIFSNTGMTVAGYIMSNRLDRAAQVLRSHRFETLTVAEVAFDCGFKSAAHFSRAFKERFNESPTQYRKQTHQ